jgi:hypothetical protein
VNSFTSLDAETAVFAVWTVIFIGLLLFWQMAPIAARRRAQPYAVSFAGIMVLLFAWLQSGSLGFSFALIPVAIIIALNITAVKTCGRCGAASRTLLILPVVKYCVHCGTELDGRAG